MVGMTGTGVRVGLEFRVLIRVGLRVGSGEVC